MGRFASAIAKAAPVATREYPLRSNGVSIVCGTDKPIVLHCRHAGFSNPEMMSAVVRTTSERRRIAQIEDEAERLIASDRLDAKTHAYAIESWDNVAENGEPLALTIALAEELLLDILETHPGLFQRWKTWVGIEANFVEMPPGDPGDLGK